MTPNRYDAIIIGGGHNGLVARGVSRARRTQGRWCSSGASSSAARRSPRRSFPGFKFSVFSYVVSLLRPEIIRDLELPRHGLQILPLESTVTPLDNGDYLAQLGRPRRNRARARAPLAARRRSGGAVRPADAPHGDGREADPRHGAAGSRRRSRRRDLRRLLKLGRHMRGLGAEQFHALHKLMTMSSADYLDEWYEFDPLKATKSASGIIGTFLGPRSPGTAYVLLHHYMGEIDGAFRAWGFQKGGTGAISEAIASAARAAGAEIRDECVGRAGARSNGGAHAASRWRTATRCARRSSCRASIRGARSWSSSSGKSCRTSFVEAIERYKFRGSSGKVNLALSGLPDFTCLATGDPALSIRALAARSRSARASTTSSARTTTRSTASSRAIRTWTS